MPIYTHSQLKADRDPWVEIDDFSLHFLERIRPAPAHAPEGRAPSAQPYWGTTTDAPRPTSMRIERRAPQDRIVITSGEVIAESSAGRFRMVKRDWFDIPEGGATISNMGYTSAELIHISGHWNTAIRTEIPAFGPGFPCDYHYHDGHEYWITYQGHFTLQYDGSDHRIGPGMLVAARRGREHGVADPEEELRAVVIATGLSAPLRDGHLTRELHGDPTPEGDRG